MPEYLLSARSIAKRFGPTNVLRGFDLSIARGEVHAFLGGNGAGKSTFIKIVSGQYERDDGAIEFEGKAIGTSIASDIDPGAIAVVNQELALLPHLSVAENIAMPRLRRGVQTYSSRLARATAVDALSLIDPQFADRSVGRLVGELTLHERQLVEIARALGSGAKLLLLDEPTANLTAAETTRLFAVVRRLVADTGLAVLFVSHRMREIRQVADVCTIIRDGKTAVDRARIESISDREIVEYMGQCAAMDDQAQTAGALGSYTRSGARRTPASERADLPKLSVRRAGIHIDVKPGMILGLAGAPTGPSGLIETLTGLAARGEWELSRGGKPLRYATTAAAARDGVGFISGDRAEKGILHSLSILDNLSAAERVVRRRYVARRAEAARAARLLETLDIRVGSLSDLPATLSGGTQQKLLVARWLALDPQLLVLEEPTRGVDIRTKREIYGLVRQLAERGCAIVWWSTEYWELVELCDAVLAFDLGGEPTRVLPRAEIDESTLADATGMAA